MGIPGLWGDTDVNGGPEHKTGAAPSVEAAIALAHELLEPTLLVGSGYGVQPWWLFEEPWIFSGPDGVAQREQAAALSRGFNGALRAAAAKHEWHLDSTYDLARLMRLPGTLNHKGETPAPVVLFDYEGPRHGFDVLYELARPYMDGQAVGNGADVTVDLSDTSWPAEKIMELCEVLPDFEAIWKHRPANKTKDWTPNQWDQSITNHLAANGFSDQEITGALIYYERRFYPGRDKSSRRADYVKRTIGKAREGRREEAEKADEHDDLLEQIAEIASTNGAVENAPELVISLFSRLVGGPYQVHELVQEGRDPKTTLFKLILVDGPDVPLGSVRGLVEQRAFRNSYAVVTGHLPKMVKGPKWDDLARALLRTATVNDHPEDTRSRIVLEDVTLYCERTRLSTDREAACALGDPFEEDGYVHIYLRKFVQWMNKAQGQHVENDRQLWMDLEAAGFERAKPNYHRPDGVRTQRSYWRAPTALIRGEVES